VEAVVVDVVDGAEIMVVVDLAAGAEIMVAAAETMEAEEVTLAAVDEAAVIANLEIVVPVRKLWNKKKKIMFRPNEMVVPDVVDLEDAVEEVVGVVTVPAKNVNDTMSMTKVTGTTKDMREGATTTMGTEGTADTTVATAAMMLRTVVGITLTHPTAEEEDAAAEAVVEAEEDVVEAEVEKEVPWKLAKEKAEAAEMTLPWPMVMPKVVVEGLLPPLWETILHLWYSRNSRVEVGTGFEEDAVVAFEEVEGVVVVASFPVAPTS
jgi:hypothetical protein